MLKTYYKTKSKAERRQWWNNLTPEEQQKYIESKQAEKTQKRRDEKDLLEAYDDLHLQSITQKDRQCL